MVATAVTRLAGYLVRKTRGSTVYTTLRSLSPQRLIRKHRRTPGEARERSSEEGGATPAVLFPDTPTVEEQPSLVMHPQEVLRPCTVWTATKPFFRNSQRN